MNVDRIAEKRPESPPKAEANSAQNVKQPEPTLEERHAEMVQLRGRGPAAMMLLSDAIDNHLWRQRALDSFESHAFSGKPGGKRWCGRCMYQLDAHWKQPHLPVPPSCSEVERTRDEMHKQRVEEAKLRALAERATRRDAINWQREARSRGNSPMPSPALDELEKQLGGA